MQSQSNTSPLMTFLMLAPLLAIPLLAVFGIPEFQSSKSASATTENDIELGTATNAESSTEQEIDQIFGPIDTSSSTNSDKHDSHSHHHGSKNDHHGLQGWSEKGSNSNTAEMKHNSTPRRDISERFEYVKGNDIGKNFETSSQAKVKPNEFLALSSSQKNDDQKVTSAQNPFSEFDEKPPVKHASREQHQPGKAHTAEIPQSWQAATLRLKELGISDYNLQPGINANEFHFSCSYTPKNNPRITHRFEAEASEPLKAVQKTIQQVEEWRQSQ